MSKSSLAHIDDLPAQTRRVLEAVASVPGVDRFVLVGGTALAIRSGHRLSEDIDLAWTETRKLPRKEIARIIEYLKRLGLDVELKTSEAAIVDYSETNGGDLLDYHQDWMVDGVKLTFFSPDEATLFKEDHRDHIGTLPVANKPEIFDSKALLFAEFCRARDVADLWWLLEKEGLPIDRFDQVFQRLGQSNNFKTAITRIKCQSYSARDPGYQALAPDLPDKDQARAGLVKRIEELLLQRAKADQR